MPCVCKGMANVKHLQPETPTSQAGCYRLFEVQKHGGKKSAFSVLALCPRLCLDILHSILDAASEKGFERKRRSGGRVGEE